MAAAVSALPPLARPRGRAGRLHGRREVDGRPERRPRARRGPRSTSTRSSSSASARRSGRSSLATARRRSAQPRSAIMLELLEAPRRPPPVVALGGGALGSAAVREALREHLSCGSMSTLRPPGGGARGPPARSPPTAMRSPRSISSARPVYEQVADVVVPQRARRRDGGRARRAGGGSPHRGQVLWATSASGDYPAYIGPGLLIEHRFWPATVAGRRFLVTDYNAGRLYGERARPSRRAGHDHARRAVQDDRPRRDRLVRAGPRGADPRRRRGRTRGRGGRRPGRASAPPPISAGCAWCRSRRRSSPRSTPPTAERPASTWPRPRTTSAPTTSPRP